LNCVTTNTGTAARGDKRRSEILRTALALFNARGTPAVSTNHVASELGISVGNLYHHFRDKDAIVRELFEEHHRKFDHVWTPPGSLEEAAVVAVQALRQVFSIAWEYRFLYRELPSLTRADPDLRKLHAKARAQRRDELRAFQVAFIELGALRPPETQEALTQLEDLSWMVTNFWLPHVELREGTLTKRAALDGVRAVIGLYLPYATSEYARSLLTALEPVEPEG
jgi:AcrR family transcriptional regulator